MTEKGTDWRVVDGVVTAWFDAPSLIEGAELAGRIVDLSADTAVDLRATGMRVRLDSDEHAEAVSVAASDLGLAANPAVLQRLSVVFESANPTVVSRFWQNVLDYTPGQNDGLTDPLRRDPPIQIQQSNELRPLRNRIHLDVVRPAAMVEQANLGEAFGPYGVCHSDPDGSARSGSLRSDTPPTVGTASTTSTIHGGGTRCWCSKSSTRRRRHGAGSATASTSSSRCRRISHGRASPRRSQPVAGSSTSHRVAGGSPTPKATNWSSSAGHETAVG